MVQHCVNAASTEFGHFNGKKQRDAADVVGSKSSSMNNALHHHIRTLGSMQSGSVDFVSTVLPMDSSSRPCSPSASSHQIPPDSASSYKTNTTASSSSSGYESVISSSSPNNPLSRSSKVHKSLLYRLRRLINFPSSKKSGDYQVSSNNNNDQINHLNSPVMSFRNSGASAATNSHNQNETRRNSLSRLDIRRKSARRTLAPAAQHIPFLYGLKNCGNTCFINAIVQCLCHTEQLASYILRKTYEIDIRNIKNALLDYHHHSSSLQQQPLGFKVTKVFVQIFQALWNNSSNTTSKLSYDFKSLIGNLNRQYSGNEQNDAQEFLLFLMNTIHDELNLVAIGRCRQQNKNSNSSATISSQSSSSIASADLARRAWSDYTNANQSIITSTFSAQLHSTLRCNQCKQESKTFEPYLLLSLPIPQKIVKPVFITVVFLNQSPKQLQIGLCLPVTNTVKDVREAIAQHSNLDPNDLALVEIQQHNGFSQVFHDTEPMSRLSHDVFAIQFPPAVPVPTNSNNGSNENVVSTTPNTPNEPIPSSLSSSSSNNSFVNLLVLNRVRYNSGRLERFGAPIAVRVPRESNYRALQLSIIKAQRANIRDEAMEFAQEFVVFQLSLVDQYQSTTSLGTAAATTSKQEFPIVHDVQWPLYLEKIVEILDAYDGPGLGPSHLQVYANWHEKYLGQFLSKWGGGDDQPDIHQSVAQARSVLHPPSSSSISLADCFSLFTQSESLNHDDAWMCTNCRRKENGTMKNLKIWTTPPVLIIHLKRFCQTKMSNAKLVYPIQFPLIGLDVRRFLSTTRKVNNDEPASDSGADEDDDDEENDIQEELAENDEHRHYGLYDLFAVCNHRGSMSNGHYTAYCQNPVTGKWFCYDDHLVSELDPSRVCTPDAYILFYRRRDTPPSPTTPSPKQQIETLGNQFDENLHLKDCSPIISPLDTIDNDLHWTTPSITQDKQHQYTLRPPSPLPRKLITPLSSSLSQDELPPPPCPLPRTRVPQFETSIVSSSPPYPAARRYQPPTPCVNYLYPLSQISPPPGTMIEPLSDFYAPPSHYTNTQRRPGPFPIVDSSNPWNRYNSQRYSDDEQERNVVYPNQHPYYSAAMR